MKIREESEERLAGFRTTLTAKKAGVGRAKTVSVVNPVGVSEVNRSERESRPLEVELIRKALDVIGSPVRLAQWVHTANPALRGQTPYSLLGSKAGRKQIETVLGRIEHGVY